MGLRDSRDQLVNAEIHVRPVVEHNREQIGGLDVHGIDRDGPSGDSTRLQEQSALGPDANANTLLQALVEFGRSMGHVHQASYFLHRHAFWRFASVLQQYFRVQAVEWLVWNQPDDRLVDLVFCRIEVFNRCTDMANCLGPVLLALVPLELALNEFCGWPCPLRPCHQAIEGVEPDVSVIVVDLEQACSLK